MCGVDAHRIPGWSRGYGVLVCGGWGWECVVGVSEGGCMWECVVGVVGVGMCVCVWECGVCVFVRGGV